MIMGELTGEQKKLFNNIESGLRKEVALEYIKNGYVNGLRAYVSACKNLNRQVSKNPDTSSCEILGYPSVVDFINSTKIEAANNAQITADWVLRGIKDLTDKLIKLEDPAKAYKGYELAGKHLKLFTDKIEQDTTLTVVRKQYKSTQQE